MTARPIPRGRATAWAALLALALSSPAGAAAPEATLTVFAAASLADAFHEIGARFESRHRGVRVRFNFAGSQQLAAQLEQGARPDVFASADPRWMDFARRADLLAGEPEVFARNRMVVILPRSNPARIGRLHDLARPGVKIVIAAGSVPAGAYARQALERLAATPGFAPDYARRVLANVVSHEDNVRAVVAKTQLGEADAGFAYRSDVGRRLERHVRTIPIPDSLGVVATYPVAVTRGGREPELARAFIATLIAGEGQAILERHGLLRAGARP